MRNKDNRHQQVFVPDKSIINKLKYFLKKFNLSFYVRKLKKQHTFFAKYLTYLILKINQKEKTILVYSMGKVGSTTVSNTLIDKTENCTIFDIHWLNKENLNMDKRFHKILHKKRKKEGINVNKLPGYIIKGYYLNRFIRNNGHNEIKVISLTRDPVSRNLSSFFQNIGKFFGYQFSGQSNQTGEDKLVDELIDLFLHDYLVNNKINFIDSDPLTWFDDELKEIFDLNVYDDPFPKEKGYKIYQRHNVSVLLMRLENLNKCFSEASMKFLGRSYEITKSKNIGYKKDYASVYNKFKCRIKLPDWYLNKMYESKYASHFYTENEIENFRSKWN